MQTTLPNAVDYVINLINNQVNEIEQFAKFSKTTLPDGRVVNLFTAAIMKDRVDLGTDDSEVLRQRLTKSLPEWDFRVSIGNNFATVIGRTIQS